jgi:transcriptional regulator GlxA family with amidase domain
MASAYKSGQRPHSSSREVVVVVVPPVDELDLVGPLQVFNSVNRLAGRKIYAIEVVTNGNGRMVEGEGGVLTFVAKHHFSETEGACDSVLLVCGLHSRFVRDATLSAWLKKKAAQVRRLGAVCVGAFLLAEAGVLNAGQQLHIGGSAGRWRADFPVSASNMIHFGSKTGISTPQPAFQQASISP